jgi:hypothetical protein
MRSSSSQETDAVNGEGCGSASPASALVDEAPFVESTLAEGTLAEGTLG